MAGIGPMSQDWEPVVIRKKAPNAAAKKDEKAVNAARRAGAEIETVRKGFLFLSPLFFSDQKIYHLIIHFSVLLVLVSDQWKFLVFILIYCVFFSARFLLLNFLKVFFVK